MQRIQYTALPISGRRLFQPMLAVAMALAAMCWIAAGGFTPVLAQSAETPAQGDGAPKGKPSEAPASDAATPATPQAAPASPEEGAAAADGADSSLPASEESTDEDAATLSAGDEGRLRQGPAGPPAAPRGPTVYQGLPTALPSPAEAGHIDEVTLPARPVAILSGRSSWDDGFKSLFDSFDVIAAELAKLGVKPTGRPITVFTSTDENGFSFEAMAPIAAAPADPAAAGGGLRFGEAPAGKAIRFTHKAPYDEIDTTYEAITAYLDAKKIAAKDAFIEEYVTDPKDTADASLQINIYVQPE